MFLLSRGGFWRQVGKLTPPKLPFPLASRGCYRAACASQGRSPGPGRVRASFGMRACPSTESRKGSGSAAHCVKALLSFTSASWQNFGCVARLDATRPGGQGRSCRWLAAAPGVRTPSFAVRGPRHDPAAKLSPAGGSDPPWAERGETLCRSSAYAAEQRL